jgi:hypothetical protein
MVVVCDGGKTFFQTTTGSQVLDELVQVAILVITDRDAPVSVGPILTSASSYGEIVVSEEKCQKSGWVCLDNAILVNAIHVVGTFDVQVLVAPQSKDQIS